MLQPIAFSVKSQMKKKIQDKLCLLMNHNIAGLSIENPKIEWRMYFLIHVDLARDVLDISE